MVPLVPDCLFLLECTREVGQPRRSISTTADPRYLAPRSPWCPSQCAHFCIEPRQHPSQCAYFDKGPSRAPSQCAYSDEELPRAPKGLPRAPSQCAYFDKEPPRAPKEHLRAPTDIPRAPGDSPRTPGTPRSTGKSLLLPSLHTPPSLFPVPASLPPPTSLLPPFPNCRQLLLANQSVHQSLLSLQRGRRNRAPALIYTVYIHSI